MSNANCVAIVSHDAGGAEILASYVAQNVSDFRLIIEGPAVKVFERKFGSIEIFNLEEGLSDCGWCLCGTSWQSDMEWRAIEQAKKAKKQTAAFLDHWTNYPERFVRYGIQNLPDAIWVGDEDAERLARGYFPGTHIRLVPNPYYEDMKHEISKLEAKGCSSDKDGITILFVCENLADHVQMRDGDASYWGYTEFDAINFFLENFDVLGERIKNLIVRPHPSDPSGKYDFVLDTYTGSVQLSDGKPLLQEIIQSDIIIGCQSMAMVIGLLARKRVISCVPPGGQVCRLPQKNVESLKDLVLPLKK